MAIDAGRADGVRPQQTVLSGAGLVGTVTTVSAHTATVLLVTDPSSTVGVRVAGTSGIGTVTGTGRAQPGPPSLRLQVFNASAVLRPGQQLVSFGSVHGKPYVPGVPVGVVTRVMLSPGALTKVAFVRPFAAVGGLGVVGVVVVPPRRDPRFSVLPPRPAPSPVPTPSASTSPRPPGSAPASPGAQAHSSAPVSPGAPATPASTGGTGAAVLATGTARAAGG
jgi:rod shape-determining protein MreC